MYCMKCGAQNGEGRQFCTKCGAALKQRGEQLSQESRKYSKARYVSEGQWVWGSAGKATDLELANGKLKFKEGEIAIHAIKSVSLIVQPFPWVASTVPLAIGILLFVIALNTGADLLKPFGVGAVAGSIGSTIGWCIGRGNRWLLIEHSGEDGHAQRIHFRMSKQQTEDLYSILRSRVKR